MTIEISQKNSNYLAIFPNFKTVIDELPYKKRARAWQILIDFSFGENIDLSKEDAMTRMAVNSIIPLIKLRKISGVKQGTINNPQGKNGKYLANKEDNKEDNIIQNNEDNKEDNSFIKEKKRKENKYIFNGLTVKLNEKDYNSWKEEYNLLDLDYELKQIDNYLQMEENKSKQKSWFFFAKAWLNKNQKREYDKLPKGINGKPIEGYHEW